MANKDSPVQSGGRSPWTPQPLPHNHLPSPPPSASHTTLSSVAVIGNDTSPRASPLGVGPCSSRDSRPQTTLDLANFFTDRDVVHGKFKPRLSSDDDLEKMVMKWPSAVHETLMEGFMEKILIKEFFPYEIPGQVDVCISHSTALVKDHGTVIPDSALQISQLQGQAFNSERIILCQVTFTESFDHVIQVTADVANSTMTTCQMVVILTVHESPPYAQPKPGSTAFEQITQALTSGSESTPSSSHEFLAEAGLVDAAHGVFSGTPDIKVYDHHWCLISGLDVWVWLRDPSTGVLDISTKTSGELVAHGSLPSGEGMGEVNKMFGRGLDNAKAYLLSFCQDAVGDSNTYNHTPLKERTRARSVLDVTPNLLWNLHQGAQETAWNRFCSFLESLEVEDDDVLRKRRRDSGSEEYVPTSEPEDDEAGPSDDHHRSKVPRQG